MNIKQHQGFSQNFERGCPKKCWAKKHVTSMVPTLLHAPPPKKIVKNALNLCILDSYALKNLGSMHPRIHVGSMLDPWIHVGSMLDLVRLLLVSYTRHDTDNDTALICQWIQLQIKLYQPPFL